MRREGGRERKGGPRYEGKSGKARKMGGENLAGRMRNANAMKRRFGVTRGMRIIGECGPATPWS